MKIPPRLSRRSAVCSGSTGAEARDPLIFETAPAPLLWALAAGLRISENAVCHAAEPLVKMVEAKADLPHGSWGTLVQLHLPFDHTTTNRLMAIACNSVLANSAHVHNLPPSYGTLYQLSRLEPPKLLAKIKDGTIHPKMQRKDVLELFSSKKSSGKSRRSVTTPSATSKPRAFEDPKLLEFIKAHSNHEVQRSCGRVWH